MSDSLTTVETYEVFPVMHERGFLFTGRITGKRIWGSEQLGVYLTSDKRVLAHDADTTTCQRLDDPPEKLLDNLDEFFDDGPEIGEVCEALGISSVIDL